ncbi:hypothetical protein C8R44DRAFT_880970 [Mycena epipterygia]|nr:hypothetical protein C8R44DRAFT_880970 [Mycena epipterygia]
MPTPYSSAFDGSLGALEIGAVVGTFFFGILTLQTFNYFRQFPEDSRTLKITIAALWLLDLAHTICTLQGIYVITVTFYGQPPSEFILNLPRSYALTILFSGVIGVIVQIFFTNRIRVLSGRLYVFLLCIALATLEFICDMIVFSNYWIYNAGYALVDSKEHWAQVRKSEFNRTRGMVDTLILWTCETTLVTSGAYIVQLILFLTRKDLSFVAVFLILSKLYSNAMLASLNGRARFRFTEVTIGSQSLAFESAGTRSRREDDRRILSDPMSRIQDSVVLRIFPTADDISAKTEISAMHSDIPPPGHILQGYDLSRSMIGRIPALTYLRIVDPVGDGLVALLAPLTPSSRLEILELMGKPYIPPLQSLSSTLVGMSLPHNSVSAEPVNYYYPPTFHHELDAGHLAGHLTKYCKVPTTCLLADGHQRHDCSNPNPARLKTLKTAPLQ